MRIGLVVCGSLEEISGGFRYDRKLVEHLRAAGETVEVIELPWPADAATDGEQAKDRRSTDGDGLDGEMAAVRERLDRPVDVLVQDELCYPALRRHNAHLERPCAIVGLVHLLDTGPHRRNPEAADVRAETHYLDSVDGVICTSRDTRRRVDARLESRVPAVVAPPAGRHDGAHLEPADVVARAREEPLRVLALGSVVPRKGQETLVDALGALEAAGDAPAFELTAVGSVTANPAYAVRVRESTETHGIDDRVRFAGTVSDDAVRAALERAHVLAVPSRYESFGMAYLEAMEYGVVPIATSVGGPPEFVTHGESGFLLEPGNRDELARALADLGNDRARLAAMGRTALEAANEHPSWEESMSRIRRFLRVMATDSATATTTFETVGGGSGRRSGSGRSARDGESRGGSQR